MMENKTILLPICGQVLLTFIVWLWMYVTRIGAIQRSGIDIQEAVFARLIKQMERE